MADILTTTEAAELMRMTIPTLRGMAAKGEIPAVQHGNEWRFLRAQLLDYMAARARDEQRARQESVALHKLTTQSEPEQKRPRGRPAGKKVDLAAYQ